MPDRWNDRFRHYPASRPLPAEDGLAMSGRPGAAGRRWWSKRFIEVLESYGLGGRMQRGRRYARAGQVLSLDVSPGILVSQVQGSRRRPYVVTIVAPQPSSTQWTKLDDAFRARAGFAARLLSGEVPIELETAFASAGVELIPARWEAFGASCTCPDSENPCKHIAAVLYLFAERLDGDPWLLLTWRGRTREELLAHLRPEPGPSRLPPWWPLAPLTDPVRPEPSPPPVERPEPSDRVLVRLPDLAIDVRGQPITELFRVAYEQIVADPAISKAGPDAG